MTSETTIALKALPADQPYRLRWRPDAPTRQAMAEALGVRELRKLTADVTFTPIGKRDWALDARWGATVVQSCVVTLEPVVTRLDQSDSLHFTDKMPEITEAEAEMPEDETLEPLPDVVELPAVVGEMIALALPPYPRADGANLGEAIYTEPGQAPMTDEDAKPFAGLASLRNKLTGSAD